MSSALFANMVQPNRRQIAFCGGVCPVPMAEFVRFVPLDNKSCHPPEGLAMPPLATKTSTSLTLIYSSYCEEEREEGANRVLGNGNEKKVLARMCVCVLMYVCL